MNPNPISWEFHDKDPDDVTHRFSLHAEDIGYGERYVLYLNFPCYAKLGVYEMPYHQAVKVARKKIREILDNSEPRGSIDIEGDNNMSNITKKQVTEIVETIIGDQLTDATWDDAALIHEVVGHALEINESKREEPTVYGTYDREGTFHTLFTGREHDIAAYINNDEYEVIALHVQNVPSGYAAHRDNIVAKRDRLQKEVDELNRRLNDRDISR